MSHCSPLSTTPSPQNLECDAVADGVLEGVAVLVTDEEPDDEDEVDPELDGDEEVEPELDEVTEPELEFDAVLVTELEPELEVDGGTPEAETDAATAEEAETEAATADEAETEAAAAAEDETDAAAAAGRPGPRTLGAPSSQVPCPANDTPLHLRTDEKGTRCCTVHRGSSA